jgi:hypothetical protein
MTIERSHTKARPTLPRANDLQSRNRRTGAPPTGVSLPRHPLISARSRRASPKGNQHEYDHAEHERRAASAAGA